MKRSPMKRTPMRTRGRKTKFGGGTPKRSKVMPDGRERLSAADWKARKLEVYARDGGRCVVCERPIQFFEADVHHKKRRGMGGAKRDDSLDNLETLCHLCHVLEHEEERRPKGMISKRDFEKLTNTF